MSLSDRRSYLKSSYWRAEEARAALDDQQASGLSVTQFAQREGLQAQRLYLWRRRFAAADDGRPKLPQFIEVLPPYARSSSVEVALRSGVVVKAPVDIDPEALAGMVSALARKLGC